MDTTTSPRSLHLLTTTDIRKSKGALTEASYVEMADPSESTPPLENLRSVSEPSCCMGASIDSAYVTALASEREPAIPSSLMTFFSACSEPMSSERRKAESGGDTSVEDAIERSKAHWSQLTEHSESDEEAKVSNVEVFQSLQTHRTWGRFFRTFGDGGIHDYGELEVGEKFAEGGQAELYHVWVTWKNPKVTSIDQEHGFKYVLKVFRKGTFLRDLQKQWPQGMFQQYEESVKRSKLGESSPARYTRYTCDVLCGTLLQDGRFAFLLGRENEDLRTFIDRCMKARTCIDSGPFSWEGAMRVMYVVAEGMFRLHNLNIVHRDLKASNVLCSRAYKNMDKHVHDFNSNVEVAIGDTHSFFVADYECSIGVVGTGFFRAPEILQALKDKVVNKIPNLFTKEGDVYSYGMVCYEILTGKLPFEGHRTNDYDLVLDGSRPEVPHHVEDWACNLLRGCWQSNPAARPTFGEILNLLEEAHQRHWNA